ncbi:MAG: LacI family DNA-binding transcriptional regulator, partial [Candidatus Nanopelagicales bacterium]
METNDARKPRRKAKLAHVALIAGVSTTTASRALRGEGRVAPATVERVRTVAEVLGYQVNVTARALRRGDANRLLGILSDPRTQLANRTEADVS